MNSLKLKTIVFPLIFLFLFTSSGFFAQEKVKKTPKPTGYKAREGVRTIPTKTEEGTFAGTWYYIDRDKRFVFFIEEEKGKNKIKIRWKSREGEEFETGMDGKCQYMYKGYEGKVTLKISNPKDKNELKGEWEWIYTADTMTRIERSTFTIYRAEDGRKLVWMLSDFERIIQSGEQSKKYGYEDMHILRKVSDRIVDWEYLPF
jgi:hypothetical protein